MGEKWTSSNNAIKGEEMKPPEFVPTAAEEAVLAGLHGEAERHGDGSKCNTETLTKLHGEVERCECFPLLGQYAAGQIPTLERMFVPLKPIIEKARIEISAEVARGIPENDIKDELKLLALLEGREQQVKESIRRYVSSVIRFHNLKRLSAGGTRDMHKQFEDADHARRRAHNSLIESLSVYLAGANNAADQDLLKRDSFTTWHVGTDAREIPQGKVVIFDSDVLKNRDFIRDYAVVADMAEQLRILGDESWPETKRDRS